MYNYVFGSYEMRIRRKLNSVCVLNDFTWNLLYFKRCGGKQDKSLNCCYRLSSASWLLQHKQFVFHIAIIRMSTATLEGLL